MQLTKLENLIRSVDLKGYRNKYQPIKIVEMDLPKDIQAIQTLYEVYWDNKKALSFEDFYQIYLDAHKRAIEEFRKKTTMCSDCFYRGLPARIYRTWASIVTQIHAGYVAESVFGEGTVAMSAQLDHQGIDFQVTYKKKILNYQVKKATFSREVRSAKLTTKKIPGEFINLMYEVPSGDYFKNPKKLDGDFKLPYKRFIENRELTRFPNGFVVFTPFVFKRKKSEIDRS